MCSMFTIIDRMLFPDFVKVVKANDKFVYPIFKNGSTTMLKDNSFTLLTPSEVQDLEIVDVYIREPYERFVSGVMTYCNEYDLNCEQAAKIINRVYFIDNHFCPQLFWVLNLKRFTNAKIRINNISDLPESKNISLRNKNNDYSNVSALFDKNSDLKFYLELDCVLYENCMNKTVSIEEILHILQTNYTDLYNQTFGYTKEIVTNLDI